jgi:gamma-glutamyl hercynylcysteine S-oxide synthase
LSTNTRKALPLEGAEALAEARERTLALVEPVTDENLDRVHDPLMSPLVWDLGHIAAFEDLWVCRSTGGGLLRPELADVYDAFESPRSVRGNLSYLRREQAIEYMEAVRERTLERLDGMSAFMRELIVRHEHQHDETMLQTLQLAEPGVFSPDRPDRDRRHAAAGSMRVEPGRYEIGAGADGFAYDNERSRHEVELPGYEIDLAPVTNGAFREFVDDGGYSEKALWSDEGWLLRRRESWTRPLYWTAEGEMRSFDRIEPIDPELPVMHISRHEAEAFARWAGGRLPTEPEWEVAAMLAAVGPGHLDQRDFGPGSAGPFIGDCWEWTASEFGAYPGFRAHPYPEYSEVFFGEGYGVLRGGSWATRPTNANLTFRNWDLPRRRQIFAGFRLARDL